MSRYILLFIAGIIADYLITLYTRYISERKRIPASLLAALITLINTSLIISIASDSSIPAILTYSLGNALGTFIAMPQKTP